MNDEYDDDADTSANCHFWTHYSKSKSNEKFEVVTNIFIIYTSN